MLKYEMGKPNDDDDGVNDVSLFCRFVHFQQSNAKNNFIEWFIKQDI
jgi:hypothetical protein